MLVPALTTNEVSYLQEEGTFPSAMQQMEGAPGSLPAKHAVPWDVSCNATPRRALLGTLGSCPYTCKIFTYSPDSVWTRKVCLFILPQASARSCHLTPVDVNGPCNAGQLSTPLDMQTPSIFPYNVYGDLLLVAVPQLHAQRTGG